MRRSVLLAGPVLLSLPLLAGCMIGNSPKEVKPTVGQELVDLKAARDKGALTDQEYSEKKLAILNGKRASDAKMIASDPKTNTKNR